jgi:hypothetical protein
VGWCTLAATVVFAGAPTADPVTIGFGMALTAGLAPKGKAALLAMQPRDLKTEVLLHPPALKNGNVVYPYPDARD